MNSIMFAAAAASLITITPPHPEALGLIGLVVLVLLVWIVMRY